jgi:hypothetical protein
MDGPLLFSLDRAQVVSVDLYAGGEGAVTWPKPSAGVFSVSTERDAYDPGDTAILVLKSPFQSAQALAVVEAPEGKLSELTNPALTSAIVKNREGKIRVKPGYDGVYGVPLRGRRSGR